MYPDDSYTGDEKDLLIAELLAQRDIAAENFDSGLKEAKNAIEAGMSGIHDYQKINMIKRWREVKLKAKRIRFDQMGTIELCRELDGTLENFIMCNRSDVVDYLIHR